MTEDDRAFLRELLLRFGKHQDAVLEELRRFGRQQEIKFEELREQRKIWQADHRELREESRAQTQALLRVIDRMARGDGGPATA